MDSNGFPISHSGHDYDALIDRWQALADEAGWELAELTEVHGKSVRFVENSVAGSSGLPLYISAGVHGDECAPVWSLLLWAEKNFELLRDTPLLLFPCLNPVGLIENSRLDGEQRDLNRAFEDRSIPLVSAWQDVVAGKRFERCLNLHEDFDALGTYLYELADQPGLGEAIISRAGSVIAHDPGDEIDGQNFDRGIARHPREGIEALVETELNGYPEAIYLFLHHSRVSITFETPSEWHIATRIQAHAKAISAFVDHSAES